MGLAELNWRTFSVNAPTATTAVAIKPANLATDSVTRSGRTVTVTTSTAHKLVSGQPVIISGATQTEYNGAFTITVTSSTTFTYQLKEGQEPDTPATGTPVVEQSPRTQRAILKAAEANSADITIGPNSDADYCTLSAGQEYLVENPPGSKSKLENWYFKSASDNQNLSVLFV